MLCYQVRRYTERGELEKIAKRKGKLQGNHKIGTSENCGNCEADSANMKTKSFQSHWVWKNIGVPQAYNCTEKR